MYSRIFLIAILCFSPLLSADNEVNIYSARKEQLIKPLLDKFSKQTGIKVNLVTGKADALLKRLEFEGEDSPADVLITVDAGRLFRAKQAKVLQAISSEVLNQVIPEHLRDPEQQWYGLTVRARPVMYVKGKIKKESLSTYQDLTENRWHKRICIRSSNNIYNQSLVAAMIANNGAEETQKWANGLVNNFARNPQGGDRDQIKAAAAGLCDIAIANTYYLGNMLHSKDQSEKDAANKMAVFWPNQDNTGVHINISGIAVTAAAKNKQAAIKLLEFMVTDAAQQWYADTNFEYPVKKGVQLNETLKQWGDFKADTLNLSELGKNNAEAIRIMDRAKWK
jgi:iron(III) transport system substrate-binding protein